MNMTWYNALILGILQGATEFLPVSSSGHLIVACNVLGVTPSLTFELALHLSTLAAVMIYCRAELYRLIKHPFCAQNARLILSTAITALIGLALGELADSMQSGDWLPLCFTLTALILTLPRIFGNTKPTGKWARSAIVGVAQGIAVIPGLSRSGLTITAGLLCGQNAKEATRSSFLLSIPIIVGSFIMQSVRAPLGDVALTPLIIGLVSAFISGIFALKLIDVALKRASTAFFSAYLVALSLLLIVLNFAV